MGGEAFPSFWSSRLPANFGNKSDLLACSSHIFLEIVDQDTLFYYE